MRKLVLRKRVRIADLAEWDCARGALARRPGESKGAHIERLAEGSMETVKTIMAYAGAMRAGDAFPPVFVIRAPGGMVLIDGTNRTKAAAFNGETEIDAVVAVARSEADASDIADVIWNGEFIDGFYPSDQPEWGIARHIALSTRPSPSGGRVDWTARRQANVDRSFARIAA